MYALDYFHLVFVMWDECCGFIVLIVLLDEMERGTDVLGKKKIFKTLRNEVFRFLKRKL